MPQDQDAKPKTLGELLAGEAASLADLDGGPDLAESLGLLDDPGAAPRKMTARELGEAIVESRQYRRSVYLRAAMGDLPPAVEIRFLDYACGRPAERMRIEDATSDLDSMSLAELEAEAERIRERAAEAQRPKVKETTH